MKQAFPETAADFQVFSTLTVLRSLHRDPVIKNLGRAQQHRHPTGNQKAHKEPGSERVRQFLHGSSPPPK